MGKTGVTICIIMFCVWGVWTLIADATPQLEFVGGTTFDFGDVQPNEKLTHTFVFKNTGEKTLKIEQVKGG